MLGETEEELALYLFVGNVIDDGLEGVTLLGAIEELEEGRLLCIHAVEHEAHLLSVGGHAFGLSLGELAAAVADVVDLVGGEFCHLGFVPRAENLLREVVVGIALNGLGSGLKMRHGGCFLRVAVHGEEHSVIVLVERCDVVLGVDVGHENLGGVCDAVGRHLDSEDAIGFLFFQGGGFLQVALGIL